MREEKIEGVVLKNVSFKEKDRILSLFTPNRGMVSLYVKGLSSKNLSLVNLTSPLSRGEFIFRKGRSDLYPFVDGTILDLHLPIRRSFLSLTYGGKMLEALLKTQLPGKSAHGIYHLFLAYLKKLPEAAHPETLWASFEMKLLKYEGLLALEPLCLLCKKNAASYMSRGEGRCERCADPKAISFSDLEWKELRLLTEARTFAPLLKIKVSPHLIQEVDSLFIAQFDEK